MVGTATFVGVALGFSIQIFSNGVRKLPLMRHPWEHVLAAGLGATFGNAMVKWEVHLQEDLDKRLQEVQSANKMRFIGAVFFLSFMFIPLTIPFILYLGNDHHHVGAPKSSKDLISESQCNTIMGTMRAVED
ncbi:unnamed protein product [Sphagnum compactum]